MLAVHYTHGTACDINSNQPRETVVFYGKKNKENLFVFDHHRCISVCDERGNDGVVTFEEVSSCYYEMIVASRWLCKLPAFR